MPQMQRLGRNAERVGAPDTPGLQASTSIAERFDFVATSWPHASAMRSDGASITYGELQERAERFAIGLASHGVAADNVVAVLAPRGIDFIVAILAILKAGAAYMPIDPEQPEERIRSLLMLRPPAMIISAGGATVPSGVGRVFTEADFATAQETTVRGALPRVAPNDAAYVMFTSGSTGTPKAVVIPHRGVTRLVVDPNYVSIDTNDTFVLLSALAFDASTFEIWGALLNGATLVIPRPGSLSLSTLADLIRTESVTILWLTAGLFHQMVDFELSALAGVRQLLAGGDVLSPTRVARVLANCPDTCLINGYGPTENTTFTACFRIPRGYDLSDGVPIGQLVNGTYGFIVDDGGKVVTPGDVGELLIGGDGLALGYANDSDLTITKFVPDVYSGVPDALLYRSGDLVKWLPDGNLAFIGRSDRQVKVRGFRIEPKEVTDLLERIADVHEAYVYVSADDRGDKTLAALVRTNISSAECRRRAQQSLPSHLMPSRITVVDIFPLNESGKVDVKALADAPSSQEETQADASSLASAIGLIWRQVLGQPVIPDDADFFDQGGDSLGAIQIIARLEEHFDIRLRLDTLYQHPTIAQLSSAVEQILAASHGEQDYAGVKSQAWHARSAPISFPQSRYLAIRDSVGVQAASSFNIAVTLQMTTADNLPHLEQAFTEIASRHAPLRAQFERQDGRLVQRAGDARFVPFEYIDLRPLNGEDRSAMLSRLNTELFTRPFANDDACRIRVRAASVADDEHVVALSLDHTAGDALSLAILGRELRYYCGRARGHTAAPPPELTANYFDYSAWQWDRLAADATTRRAYWRTILARAEHALPADSDDADLESALVHRRLDAPIPKRIEETCGHHGGTLFAAATASFRLALWQRWRMSNIPIGCMFGHRLRANFEPLIGVFSSTAPLCSSINASDTFLTLLQRERDTVVSATEHHELPFELLADACPPWLEPWMKWGHFQVMINMPPLPRTSSATDDFKLALTPTSTTSKANLSLNLLPSADGALGLALKYRAKAYRPSTIEAIVERLVANLIQFSDPASLSNQIAASSGQSIASC